MDITLSNFFAVISILVGFTCSLLAVFLLIVPSGRRLPNRFLAAFLILTAIELSVWLWLTPENADGWINAIRLALGTLQMPIFYGFFVSSCYSDFKLRPRDALHLVPFVIALMLALPGSQIPLAPEVGATLYLSDLESHIFWIASHIQYYAYMVAVITVLVQFRRLFHAHHSGDRSEVLTWLTQLAAVSLFAHTLILVRNLLLFTGAPHLVLVLQVLGILLALAITSWIALKSLLQPHLFRDVDRRLIALSRTNPRHQHAIVRSPQLERLEAFMDTDEPYLNADLTLASLSAQVAMTPREVSELLNQTIGVHFFDFINGYRIKKAQKLLLAQPRQSVLDVLYAVGFNSKSSFNTAFKKHSGLTPSAFRAQQPDTPASCSKAPEAFDY
jgi:AraC-like DNA-binding protein